MEAPELHGGGAAHASTPVNGYVASQLTEIPEMPDTPTPSQWTQLGLSRPSTDENDLNLARASQKNSLGGAGAHRNGIASSLTSRARNIIKQRQASKGPLGHRGPYRAPLINTSKQFQALAGAIEQQAESQQQARQGELEIIWTQVMEQLNTWKAEQQIREEHLLGRVSTLELEVSKLQTELNQAQQALKTSTTGQSETAHRPASRATEDITAKKAPKDASKPREAPRSRESMKQPPKKGASFADIAALLATKPGGQEWQTVPAKPSKPQKMEGHRGSKVAVKKAMKARNPESLTPVKERNKEARRLLFRREGGLAAPKAEREEVILAINRGLAKENFPGFIRVADMGYTATGAMTVLLERGSLGSMLLPDYRDLLVAAARQADPAVISAELPEQWYRVKVHGVPIKRYLTRGLELAREEIELGTEFQLKRNPTWLRNPQELKGSEQKGSTIVITVGSLEEAQKLLINGIRFGGSRYRTEHYWELGPDTGPMRELNMPARC
ncbi:hypothetical protein VTN00DRAFT_5208 [Thermoascus crustaceus]|uniref:uncharacterized protein n=1 Tax=Thermoascus crustaceus TaxID=5088 RepID=UPI0037420F6C